MSALLENFTQRLASGELLLGDGAWGTQMQALGLDLEDCPEEWNATHPDKVSQVARSYLQAGADFCITNTFGANRYRLNRFGLAERVRELNSAGLALSRQAADEFGKPVVASVGPTGEFIEPEGMLKTHEMYDAFREQMEALKENGAEAVCIETMYVLDEALAAIKAARDLGLFCFASMTYDSTPQGFRTMLGTTVAEATKALDAAGADVVGTNCGNGITQIAEIVRLMRPLTRKPLLARANAGLPEKDGKRFVYRDGPQFMASKVRDLREAGAAIIGGCCGTTPEHIRAFRAAIDVLLKPQMNADKRR